MSGHTASVLSVAFSPDGASLATASVDTHVRLWRTADGSALAGLNGHSDFVFAVAFAPDGKTLASGAADGSVRLWPLGASTVAPPTAEPPSPAASGAPNCGQCHHPHGSSLSPNSLQPARVLELRCSLCHTGGPLVRSWDPTFTRSPGSTTLTSLPPVASDKVGVPHGSEDLRVEIAVPANGETLYSGGKIVAFVPVAGRVALAAGQATEIELSLEIWSGTEQMGAWSTRARPDGTFSFALGVNVDGSSLNEPIDLRDCQVCHEPNYEGFSAGASHPTLPLAGEIRLLVRAQTPAGLKASDERWVTVDPSGQARLSVQTVLEGAAGEAVAGLPVQAETRLYEWRGRTFFGTTGAAGDTNFLVEALAAAPTRYILQIQPTVVNRRLYESVAPVEVVLPPGALSAPAVTLTVRARAGHIGGQLAANGAPVTIFAIHLPEGARYDAATNSNGTFTFDDLPIGRYLLLADAKALALRGLAGDSQLLDLAQSPDAEVNLSTRPLLGSSLLGTVTDEQGRRLPFGWVSLGENGPQTAVSPVLGAWQLPGLMADSRTIVARAPGFFSQAAAIVPQADPAEAAPFRLTALPGMRRLAWGSGEISLPPETQAVVTGRQIELESGWLWGAGAGSEPWVIQTAGVVITLDSGDFALVNRPGQTAWVYLLEGQAEVHRSQTPGQTTVLTGPTMLALATDGELTGVPLDPIVMQAMSAGGAVPIALVWEPSLAAQMRDGLARLGIRSAQILTIGTYLSAIAAIFAVPAVAVIWWARRRRLGARP
ncbi:MAG: hypothetical protein ABI847_04680 [Anaerolineales bacterium]